MLYLEYLNKMCCLQNQHIVMITQLFWCNSVINILHSVIFFDKEFTKLLVTIYMYMYMYMYITL